MTDSRRILVTSALPYANGPIHLGHLAGAYLPADVFVRYHRLEGNDVVFICGSDEHGTAIVTQAFREGTTPQEIVDRYHAMAERDFAAFGMSFDYYGRTSAPIHHETSRDWFRTLAEKDAFVLKTSPQPYDPKAKLFLADRFIVGTCPNPSCKNPSAYGDQCEKCGTSLSPSELVEPRSALTDAALEWRDTTHWYLPARHVPARHRGVDRHEDALEGQRAGPDQELVRGGPRRPRHDPRPPLGRPRPRGRRAEGRRRSDRQGPLRLVRRADRLRLRHARVGREAGRSRALEGLLAGRRDAPDPLHRQGQHRLPHHQLPLDAEAPRRLRAARRTCRPTSSSTSRATSSRRAAAGPSG
ncbi:MAG: class I tRNA ligase family protein [Sandaracinaceae bacterium]|nr:class I tRNA ligase family protein [Sandaracinaceae bacterium]